MTQPPVPIPSGIYGPALNELLLAASAGLANRHYARCNEVWIGDSHVEGQGQTNYDYSWIHRRRDLLRARYPTIGLTGGGRGFLPIVTTGQSSYTAPFALSGTVALGGYGPKQSIRALQNGTDTAIAALNCTSADILFTQGAVGSVGYYSFNGGVTKTTFAASGASIQDGQLLRVTPTAPGANTLQIGWSSGSNVFVDGVVEYNGDETAGIQVHDAGHYGWTSANWAAATDSTRWPAAVAALAPSLIGISLGTNDKGIGMPPSTFTANLLQILANLRIVPANQVPIVLVTPSYVQGGSVYPISAYAQAAAQAAAIDVAAGNMTFAVDMSTKFPQGYGSAGTPANSPFGIYNTSVPGPADVHMTNKGASLWNDYLFSDIPLAA